MQLLISFLNINQKRQISWLNRNYSSWSIKPCDTVQYTRVDDVWEVSSSGGGWTPLRDAVLGVGIRGVIDLQLGQVKAGLRVMSRCSVEGQGLTYGGELRRLLNFLCEIIKKQSVIISVRNCCGGFQRCFCNDANTFFFFQFSQSPETIWFVNQPLYEHVV